MKNFCFSLLLLFALCMTGACGGDSTEVPDPGQNPSEQPEKPDNPTPDNPEKTPLDADGNIQFPDAKFASYMNCTFDTDHDGGISPAEAAAITRIEVPGWEIESVAGIEYCTELTYLDCCQHPQFGYWTYNKLTSLDVSKNTKLTYLYCDHNQLTSLDVSKNTELTELHCQSNQLTTLDVSKNTKLTDLNCRSNPLTTLNVSKNTKLTYLDCNYNQLTTLDVSKNTELTNLDCSYNQLTTLDVSNNTKLIGLYCGVNQLTELDVSKNTKLIVLWCDGNQLTTLDVSMTDLVNNSFTQPLDCSMESLKTLYLNKDWEGRIEGIDKNRSTYYIAETTTILYK